MVWGPKDHVLPAPCQGRDTSHLQAAPAPSNLALKDLNESQWQQPTVLGKAAHLVSCIAMQNLSFYMSVAISRAVGIATAENILETQRQNN